MVIVEDFEGFAPQILQDLIMSIRSLLDIYYTGNYTTIIVTTQVLSLLHS